VTDGLRFTYYADDDGEDFGRLQVEVQHEGFAGVSDCYFARTDLMRFGEQLGAYPLPEAAPRLIGGYGYPEIDDVAILLSATQISPLGQVGIEVRLRKLSGKGPSAREVWLTMPTTYARLDDFHRAWLAVLSAESSEMVELGVERI
jgi:hypothetical protein